MFADTVSGAKASASLYSLVQTVRANEIEPYAYLRRMPAELPVAQSVKQIEALWPWNVNFEDGKTSEINCALPASCSV
jgi:transposase